ncbi:hypothetical protein [Methylobacterium sp. Leaf112]|uniref:hypothetical protein n=1 Tax=Methylobacterium sp. Leaf112 TaxID=1736258 RepID=UPI0006FC1DDF|nr:hypothetical protein [Methylobacterium sp. Leaf112]KQP62135.1 hypothetical protein ASF52_05615 [Methylobacterium sp. Leaf112]
MTTNETSWHVGFKGLSDVKAAWAYVYEGNEGEPVRLVRGSFRDGFYEEGTERSLGYRVICWTDAADRPSFDQAAVRALLGGIEQVVEYEQSVAFATENWLHRQALEAVVYGNPEAIEIAQLALGSHHIEINRYYGAY